MRACKYQPHELQNRRQHRESGGKEERKSRDAA